MAEIKMGGWIEDKDALASFIAKKPRATSFNSKMIAEMWDDSAKSKAFFSARVTDADILEGIRRQVARVVSGEIGQSDARFWIRNFLETKGDSALEAMGFLPHEEGKDAGLSELANTSRLDLIIEQNVRMAQAARKYQELAEEKDSFPYVQYHTREDGKVRNSHALLNNKIFRVGDPDLRHIMPPQDYRCRCWLTRISEDELDGRPVEDGLPPGWKPPASGYTFDPEKWMEQGQEAREQWGDDLKQSFLEETSKQASAELAFLEGRRKFWADQIINGQDIEETETAEEAVKQIDARMAAIKKQMERPIAKAMDQAISELDAALAKAEGEARKANGSDVLRTSFANTANQSTSIIMKATVQERFAIVNNLADNVSYSGISSDIADDMNAIISRSLREFPELRKDMQFIGSISGRNKLFSDKVYDVRLREFMAVNTQFALDEAKRELDGVFYSLLNSPRSNVVAEGAFVGGIRGIAINDTWGKEKSTLLTMLANDVDKKVHPVGCASIEYIIEHEVGHYLDDLLKISKDASILIMWRRLSKEEITAGLSSYAWDNDQMNSAMEFVSEAWAEFRCNKMPRPISEEVGETILYRYKQWKNGQ